MEVWSPRQKLQEELELYDEFQSLRRKKRFQTKEILWLRSRTCRAIEAQEGDGLVLRVENDAFLLDFYYSMIVAPQFLLTFFCRILLNSSSEMPTKVLKYVGWGIIIARNRNFWFFTSWCFSCSKTPIGSSESLPYVKRTVRGLRQRRWWRRKGKRKERRRKFEILLCFF